VFTREEDEGRIPLVVLSDGLWRRSFSADPSVIGRAVMISRRAARPHGIVQRTPGSPLNDATRGIPGYVGVSRHRQRPEAENRKDTLNRFRVDA
jgi:hypothetical protein